MPTVICEFCGTTFERENWRVERSKRQFCSRPCSNAWKIGKYTQEEHPRFINLEDIGDFTLQQKDLIIGTVLGDASIAQHSLSNAHLSVSHSARQLAYLQHKYKLLQPFSRPIKSYSRFDLRYNKTYITYRFWTRCHPFLTGLRKLFYSQGKKHLPMELCKNLSPLSLAIWYLDDGAIVNHCAYSICTVNFKYSNVEQVCRSLQKQFALKCWPTKDGRIYISAKSRDAFTQLILPFVPNCMSYKLLE